MNIQKCQNYQQFFETLDYVANVTLSPECSVSTEKIRLFLFNNQCFYQSERGIYLNSLLRHRLTLLEGRVSLEWSVGKPENQELQHLVIENRRKRSEPSLPFNIWDLVYDYLSKKDKIKFSSVCKDFKLLMLERINKGEISLDDYAEWLKMACLKNGQAVLPYSLIYNTDKLTRVMNVWGRHLRRLETFLFDEKDINYAIIFQACQNLKFVRIKEGGGIRVQGFEALLKVQGLQSLHIEGETHFGSNLPNKDLTPQLFQRGLVSLDLAGISNLYLTTYEGFPATLQSLFLSCSNHRFPICWRVCVDCKALPKGLRRLDLSGWIKLETIQNLDYLEDLEELILRGCPVLKKLEGIERLRKLQSIDVSNCPEILNTNSFENLIFLQTLIIQGDAGLSEIPLLKKLPSNLFCLVLSKNTQLTRIPISKAMLSLKKLVISECPRIVYLGSMEMLVSLLDLSIIDCEELNELGGYPPNLERLDISRCPRMRSAPDWNNLSKLKVLMILGDLANFRDFKAPGSLEELHLTANPSCTQLNLENLKKLIVLKLRNCERLEAITGIENLKSLRTIYLKDCKRLKFASISQLKKAKDMNKDNLTLIIDGHRFNQSANCCSVQ